MGFARSLKPQGAVQLREVERVSSLLRKLLEVLKLGSTIALAKGMHVIDVADDVSRRACKILRGQSFQELDFTRRRCTSPMPVSI